MTKLIFCLDGMVLNDFYLEDKG